MNYILLDLEWNSAYSHKYKRFINEIVQIGAVKLDSSFREVSRFNVMVKSALTKKLSGRFIALTGITNEIMRDGIPFSLAVKKYNEWACDDDFVTMTYSDSDLYAIYENCTLLMKEPHLMHIGKYADLQSLVQGYLNDRGADLKNQISLSDAAKMLGVDITSYDMHTADDDSMVSASLLKICYSKERFNKLVKNADAPDFYERLTFKSYPIRKINDPLIDSTKLKFNCENCGSKAKRKTRWSYSNRWFRADFICKKCETQFSGRVSFKKTFDNVEVRRKIVYSKPLEESSNGDSLQSMPTQV